MGDIETEYAARIVSRVWNGHGGVWAVVIDVNGNVDVDVVIDMAVFSLSVRHSSFANPPVT